MPFGGYSYNGVSSGIWVIHTGPKSGCKLVTLFDSYRLEIYLTMYYRLEIYLTIYYRLQLTIYYILTMYYRLEIYLTMYYRLELTMYYRLELTMYYYCL